MCALNALAVLEVALGSLDRVARVLTVTGFVSSAPDFHQQPAVVDGASKVLADVFGEAGRHTRSAIGVAALPRNGAVEIEVTVALGLAGLYQVRCARRWRGGRLGRLRTRPS